MFSRLKTEPMPPTLGSPYEVFTKYVREKFRTKICSAIQVWIAALATIIAQSIALFIISRYSEDSDNRSLHWVVFAILLSITHVPAALLDNSSNSIVTEHLQRGVSVWLEEFVVYSFPSWSSFSENLLCWLFSIFLVVILAQLFAGNTIASIMRVIN